jgi:pilus assembly protein CpaB
MTIGTISLSLRALADNQSELEQALATGKLNMPKGASGEEEAAIIASVQKQPTSGPSTYATGGQVSRFQRNSIPAITPVQKATEAVQIAKQVEKVSRGPVVRVSRGGNTTEVPLDRR